jgi:hypothetical protein
VEKVAGYAPYYTEALDNLEMYDLAAAPSAKLIYSGPWAHENGKSMYTYQRSISTSQGAGAALTYTFIGTGIDILGANNGSAVLEVTVDGQVAHASANTKASSELYHTFSLRGLPYGVHTVQFKVKSGTLSVDAIGIVSSPSTGSHVQICNRATGQCIDGLGRTANGANTGQWASNPSYNQQWLLEPAGSYIRLKNRATGLYLDGMGRSTDGSIAGQWADSNSHNQQWIVETTSGGFVKFKNRATGLYLDGAGKTVNNEDLKQWGSSFSYNQQWLVSLS